VSELKGEAGLGYQDVSVVTGQGFDQVTGRIKLDFNHKFNDIYSFAQDALYATGSEQDKIETNTGLRAALSSQLSASFGYKYRYNSNPGTNVKKTDGETNLSLIYNF
jgi:putative salt-induced outer membrane protein